MLQRPELARSLFLFQANRRGCHHDGTELTVDHSTQASSKRQAKKLQGSVDSSKSMSYTCGGEAGEQ
jgi:hypothetical protein